MNEKEAVMAKPFENGFPGQALGQGSAHAHAHVPDAGLEPGTPPVELPNFPDPEARPDFLGTESTFEHPPGLPTIPPEQAFNPAPFDDDEDFPGDVPGFLDFC